MDCIPLSLLLDAGWNRYRRAIDNVLTAPKERR
jgi:hypothetical protein